MPCGCLATYSSAPMNASATAMDSVRPIWVTGPSPSHRPWRGALHVHRRPERQLYVLARSVHAAFGFCRFLCHLGAPLECAVDRVDQEDRACEYRPARL